VSEILAAGFPLGEFTGREPAAEVIAFDDRDTRRAQAERSCDFSYTPGRHRRIGGAKIADDLDAGREALLEHRRQQTVERGTVAARRIFPTLQLTKGQGALGESLIH